MLCMLHAHIHIDTQKWMVIFEREERGDRKTEAAPGASGFGSG